MSDSASENNKSSSSRWWKWSGAFLVPLLVAIISYLCDDPQIRIPLVLFWAAIAGWAVARFVLAFKEHKRVCRKIFSGIFLLFSGGMIFLMIQWKKVSDNGGQIRQEPFRIAGNLYYVGTKDVTSFLLTGPQGHVLIDGGYPGTAELIMENIRKLGFKITDVKILLNTHAHLDHAGGLAALQEASGAQLWISEGDADIVSSGGYSSRSPLLMNFVVFSGLAKFPAPRIDHRFKNGTVIHLGPIELTAHVTPGHTPGCTTWSFPVQEGARRLLAVNVGSLTLVPIALTGERYDAQLQQEFRQSFDTLRSLPADIFLGSHAGFFDMNRKLKERAGAIDPVSPFIDRAGYLQYISEAEKELQQAVLQQEKSH